MIHKFIYKKRNRLLKNEFTVARGKEGGRIVREFGGRVHTAEMDN